MYDERQIVNAIDRMQEFSTRLDGQIEEAKSCADTCIANMEGDVVATEKSQELKGVMENIQAVLSTNVNKIMSRLQHELEVARRIAQSDD